MNRSVKILWNVLKDIFGEKYIQHESVSGKGDGLLEDAVFRVYCPIDNDKLILLSKHNYRIKMLEPHIDKNGLVYNRIELDISQGFE